MYRQKKRCLLVTIALLSAAIVALNFLTSGKGGGDEVQWNIKRTIERDAVQARESGTHSGVINTSHGVKKSVKGDARDGQEDYHHDMQPNNGRDLLQMKRTNYPAKSMAMNTSQLEHVLKKVDTCLSATHLDNDPGLESRAKENTAYFLKEFRKIIPISFLSNYTSHCWRDNFEISLDSRRPHQVKGHISQVSFDVGYNEVQKECLYDLQRRYHGHFTSSLVCLPKAFILGFPKCGSTFLWCFLERLLRQAQKWPAHSEKEPHFWMRTHFPTTPLRQPIVTDISDYVANFVGGIEQIAHGNKGLVLMDGNPNLIFMSPRFDKGRERLENNCLLPALLPHFLPKAKYVVIMRNPIKMLYSAFWFSCTCCHASLSKATQLKGPDLFHNRVTAKIDRFNDCMRDIEVPDIGNTCFLSDSSYRSCIRERLHLIDRCVDKITYDIFSPELPNCGRTRVERSLYFVHIRKWLSVVAREKFYFVTLEEIGENPHTVAEEMLQFVDAPSLSMTNFHGGAQSSLNACAKENSQKKIDYKNRRELHMREDTKELLTIFFRPFNDLLADLLGDSKYKSLWK